MAELVKAYHRVDESIRANRLCSPGEYFKAFRTACDAADVVSVYFLSMAVPIIANQIFQARSMTVQRTPSFRCPARSVCPYQCSKSRIEAKAMMSLPHPCCLSCQSRT